MMNSYEMNVNEVPMAAEEEPVCFLTYGLIGSTKVKLLVDEAKKVVELTEDGAIAKLVVAAGNYGSTEEATFENVTVIGFTLRAKPFDRPITKAFDGVGISESYLGGDRRHLDFLDLYDVRDIVIGITVPDGENYSERILVDNILELEAGKVVDVTTPEELTEALASLEDGETVRLAGDITYGSPLSVGASEVTIDLGGNKLAMETGAADRPITVQQGASLTLKNGTLARDEAGSYGLVENYGELTLDSMTVTENGGNSGATFRNMTGGHMIVNGGSFTNSGSSANQIFRNHAGQTDTYLEINDATLSSEAGLEYCVVIRSGEAVINNVITNGTHGSIAVEGGKVTIDGGVYNTANYYGVYVSNAYEGSEVEINGGTFVGGTKGNNRDVLATAPDGDSQGSKQKGNVTVTINDAECPHKVALGNTDNTQGYVWNLVVKGGTYGEDPSAYVPEGYQAVEEEGKWVVKPVA